jgi:mRNA interferase RelE/StbE
LKYVIGLKPKAEKDLKALQEKERTKLIERLRHLENDLGGDVKMLTNHTPEYRMRSGDRRVLFEVAGDRIIVYRILHRKDAYR